MACLLHAIQQAPLKCFLIESALRHYGSVSAVPTIWSSIRGTWWRCRRPVMCWPRVVFAGAGPSLQHERLDTDTFTTTGCNTYRVTVSFHRLSAQPNDPWPPRHSTCACSNKTTLCTPAFTYFASPAAAATTFVERQNHHGS